MREEKRILDMVVAIGITDDITEIRRTTLDRIRKMVWFDTANFWLYPPLSPFGQQEHVVIDTPMDSLNNYLQYYINIDEFHQTYNKKNLLIARSTDLLDYGRWTQRSEYYYDFLKSESIHYMLAFDIKDENMAYGAICIHREKCHGDFQDKDICILRLVYPHLVNRLRWLYERQLILSELQIDTILKTPPKTDYFHLITVRERVVVQQALSGASNQEIAKNLGLSVNTVKMHLQNIFMKLRIKRRSQLFTIFSAQNTELPQ